MDKVWLVYEMINNKAINVAKKKDESPGSLTSDNPRNKYFCQVPSYKWKPTFPFMSGDITSKNLLLSLLTGTCSWLYILYRTESVRRMVGWLVSRSVGNIMLYQWEFFELFCRKCAFTIMTDSALTQSHATNVNLLNNKIVVSPPLSLLCHCFVIALSLFCHCFVIAF